MSGTIWLGDLLIWCGVAGVAMVLGFVFFYRHAEASDGVELFLHWLAVAGLGALFFGMAVLGLLPGELWPVLWLVFPAGLAGCALGAVTGLIRHR
ncbi:MAG: hypothetical protein RIA08_15910 [Roseovarius sp.]|uniref:hypothetical protein n=1 Tax=Roseobacteraceae TaxID=2854170 RepID=UPI0032EF7CAF